MSDALINGLSGAGGGIIAQLLTYPLQTVVTRQQTRRDPSRSSSRSRRKKNDHDDNGTIQQMRLVLKNEGWSGLYGGLAPSLVGTAASEGVYYYWYQIFRNRAEASALRRWKRGLGDGSVGMFHSLLVAALSGCVNVLLTNPIWVVVTRLQTHKKTTPPPTLPDVRDETAHGSVSEPLSYGTMDVVQELFDEAGIWGLWKGVIPTLIMVSNPSIQFMLYETFLKKLKKKRTSNMKGADGLTAIERVDVRVTTGHKLSFMELLQAPLPPKKAWLMIVSKERNLISYVFKITCSILIEVVKLLLYTKNFRYFHKWLNIVYKMGESEVAENLHSFIELGIYLSYVLVPADVFGLRVSPGSTVIFLLGAVAKLGAIAVTYPLNVVKSRLQVKQGADNDKRHSYKGTIDAVTKMVRHEGVSGFYQGMGTKIVQSVLAAAVLFMVKEELVRAARLLVTGDLKLMNKSKPKPP